jgi:4-hydroxy-tetrahydrodipicolinate synthase
MVAMIKACQKGNMAEALRLHEQLLPVSNAMFIETSPGPVKTAMSHLGLSAGDPRLPLVAMGKENKHKLIAVLKECGLDRIK